MLNVSQRPIILNNRLALLKFGSAGFIFVLIVEQTVPKKELLILCTPSTVRSAQLYSRPFGRARLPTSMAVSGSLKEGSYRKERG